MKVCVVAGAIHRARVGAYGSESQSAVLARGFERAGHEVTFIAAAGSDKVGHTYSVPCMYGQMWPNEETKEYEWYRDVLREQDFILDWSGTHRVTENLWFWDSDWKGVLVWNHQGNEFTSPRPPAISAYHGVVVSQAQKEHAIQNQWFEARCFEDPSRIHVIPYGIDTETYHPPADGARAYFLYLSRPHPHKGLFDFLMLAQENPDENFIMAFDMAAPDHVRYGNLAIKEAKEIPNVTYVPLKGNNATKVDLYQHAKALVAPLAPEYTEGFGLVFAEAMACGTPCITAKHGGQVDVVGDLGWLCETEEDYLTAILGVGEGVEPGGFSQDWHGRIRARIVQKFSVDRQVKAYMKLYEKVRREQDQNPNPSTDWLW
jgi:glycosyltransferase involved in cell wall biosynthesis